jgi:hypothetical protein
MSYLWNAGCAGQLVKTHTQEPQKPPTPALDPFLGRICLGPHLAPPTPSYSIVSIMFLSASEKSSLLVMVSVPLSVGLYATSDEVLRTQAYDAPTVCIMLE